MTHVIKNGAMRIVVLADEPDAICELCGKTAELRPYGSNGERICWDCGQKDKGMTARRMGQVLYDEGFDS